MVLYLTERIFVGTRRSPQGIFFVFPVCSTPHERKSALLLRSIFDGADFRSGKAKPAGNIFIFPRALTPHERKSALLLRSIFDGADFRSGKAKPAGNIFYISKGFNDA